MFSRIKKIFGAPIVNESLLGEIAFKKQCLEKSVDKIEQISLGSSHGAYSFAPKYFKKMSYNLCSSSQDLYYSYRLYLTLQNAEKLKTIYLFFSVFSTGLEVIRTSDKEICAYFKYFFNIDYQYPTEDNKFKKNIIACEHFISKNKLTHTNYLGYKPLFYFYPENYSVNLRAETHLRENQRDNCQFHYLHLLYQSILKNNQKLVIIIPPARKDYREALPEKSILFGRVKKFSNDNKIELIDLYDMELFLESDFGDFDHLNRNGAQKLSLFINDTYVE